MEYFISFVASALALITSIVLHELAHGYVALWNGDPTAKYSGRLSLNPIKHFDAIGFLMLLFMRFGYAKPVPVNPNNFRNRKLGSFTVSIAGITVNLLLSFLTTAFLVLIEELMPYTTNLLFYAIYYLFYAFSMYNLFLLFFNFLPLYPLDGYRIIESLTRFTNPVTKFLRNYGTMILIALVGLSVVASIFASSNYPQWLDLLGMYFRYTAQLLQRVFENFWRLLFGFARIPYF